LLYQRSIFPTEPRFGSVKLHFQRAISPTEPRFPEIELKRMWHQIVGIYSHKSITFEGDRLVALSILARAAACNELGQYIVGIWSRDLPQGLALGSTGSQNRRATTYRAPTWSWALLEGPVTYLSPRE
jgi:hypothetical protein